MSRTQPTRRRSRSRRAGRGAALIVVMWVVVIASLIMLGLLKTARVNFAMAHSELSIVQARWLARAGVERAIATLSDDSTDVDSADDYWYEDDLSFEDVELSDGYSFDVIAPADDQDYPTRTRFGMVDAASRVNLNVADAGQLKAFAYLTDAQVAALVDWRDGDHEVLPGGAEHAYYERLDFPYQIRNGPFVTPREPLLVRGMDEQAYFGEDANLNGVLDANEDDGRANWPDDNTDGQLQLGLAGLTNIWSFEVNKTADGDDRVNVNTADAQKLTSEFNFTDALANAVVQKTGSPKYGKLIELLDIRAAQQSGGNASGNRSPASSGSDGASETEEVSQITVKWLAEHLDELTRTDDERLPGRINVNTASEQVLASLPEIDDKTARNIIAYRDSERGPFYSVGELVLAEIVTEKQFKAIAEMTTVRSNVFVITSRGRTPWGIEQTIVAVVDRSADPVRILYWRQSE